MCDAQLTPLVFEVAGGGSSKLFDRFIIFFSIKGHGDCLQKSPADGGEGLEVRDVIIIQVVVLLFCERDYFFAQSTFLLRLKEFH